MIEDYINFKNILITTRLRYVDDANIAQVTEERNLFFINRIADCCFLGDDVVYLETKDKDVKTLQYSSAFDFPELFEKELLNPRDFTERELKKGDFNKEFKYHECQDGEYFVYFSYHDIVYRIRGMEVNFSFDRLSYMFYYNEMESVSSDKILLKELKNYDDTTLPIIRKNKLNPYF